MQQVIDQYTINTNLSHYNNLRSMNKQILTREQIKSFRGRSADESKVDGMQPSKLFDRQQVSSNSSNPQQQTETRQVNTKKKNGKKYRVYTNLDLYDGNELSVGKARATEKFKTVSSPIEIKLPQIQPIRYVLKKNIQNYPQPGSFMKPTFNSIISRKQKTRATRLRSYDFRNLSTLQTDYEGKQRERQRSKLRLRERDQLKPIHIKQNSRHSLWRNKLYYPPSVLEQSRIIEVDKERCECCHNHSPPRQFRSEYLHVRPRKLHFYQLETEYARQANEDDKEEDQQLPKEMILSRIPAKEDLEEFLKNYSCKNEAINMEKLTASRHFIVEYSSKELYFGDMVNGRREGKGVLINDNSVFEGYFMCDDKVKGLEINHHGVYKGEYYLGKKEGNGEFQWVNGEYYIGEWKAGKRHGNGLWLNRAGDSYNGSWVNGRGEGYGVYVVKGQKYKGQFLDFKKHGWGQQTFPNGDFYEGYFVEGLPSDKGFYEWADSTTYEGQFRDGFRHGRGILKTATNLVYEGEFFQQRPEGLCELKLPNGDTYKGMLKNGMRHGEGVFTSYRTRQIFNGYWQKDEFLQEIVI